VDADDRFNRYDERCKGSFANINLSAGETKILHATRPPLSGVEYSERLSSKIATIESGAQSEAKRSSARSIHLNAAKTFSRETELSVIRVLGNSACYTQRRTLLL
jgi:hypothetical protein